MPPYHPYYVLPLIQRRDMMYCLRSGCQEGAMTFKKFVLHVHFLSVKLKIQLMISPFSKKKKKKKKIQLMTEQLTPLVKGLNANFAPCLIFSSYLFFFCKLENSYSMHNLYKKIHSSVYKLFHDNCFQFYNSKTLFDYNFYLQIKINKIYINK